MNYNILKDKTSYFKLEDEGVNHMCDFFEELRQAGRKEAEEEANFRVTRVTTAEKEAAVAKAEAKEATKAAAAAKKAAAAEKAKAEARNFAVKNALRMLISGKLTLDEIAEYTNLSLDEVKEFAAITSAAK